MLNALQEELLRRFLEQGRDYAVILLDPEGCVLGWLAGAETILGYTAAEMSGKTLELVFTPEDRERGVAAQELAVAAARGRSEDDRWQLRKDGRRLWVNGSVTAVRDPADHRVVGFCKILTDRTDLRGHIETLERRADALERKGERNYLFLATLAHELRNPLAPLSGAIELIHRSQDCAEDLHLPLKVVERQLEVLRRLVDDLHDTVSATSGKMQLSMARLQVQDVLQAAFEACESMARRRQQQYQTLFLPAPIFVRGDADRLQQVFVNLLTNAIKYTGIGGRILFKLTVEDDHAVARVEDNGVGIDASMLPRIFDLFTQEDSSAKHAAGGLGLGLPIVRELVQAHGGTVQVRSEGRGHGSEFTVRLPLEPAPANTDTRGSPGSRT